MGQRMSGNDRVLARQHTVSAIVEPHPNILTFMYGTFHIAPRPTMYYCHPVLPWGMGRNRWKTGMIRFGRAPKLTLEPRGMINYTELRTPGHRDPTLEHRHQRIRRHSGVGDDTSVVRRIGQCERQPNERVRDVMMSTRSPHSPCNGMAIQQTHYRGGCNCYVIEGNPISQQTEHRRTFDICYGQLRRTSNTPACVRMCSAQGGQRRDGVAPPSSCFIWVGTFRKRSRIVLFGTAHQRVTVRGCRSLPVP